jgi:hypothetical protein
VGWHYYQLKQYAEARRWFQRSASLHTFNNPIAYNYLRLLDTLP